jgi:hypothetical protein
MVDGQRPEPSAAPNPLFELLVLSSESSQDQVKGLVAYGLYKNAKREWTIALTNKRGRPPTEQEIETFVSSWTPSRLDALLGQAESALIAYSGAVVDKQRPEILKEAVRGTFWSGVGRNMAANALYTVSLIIAAVLISRSGIDILEMVRAIAGTSFTP